MAVAVLLVMPCVHAQQSDDRPKQLLKQMIAALGGDAWLNRSTWVIEGRAGSFYKNEANMGVMPFIQYHKAVPGTAGVDRLEMSKKRDVLEIWTKDQGWEVTFKGHKTLPKDIVTDYFRRQAHNLDQIVQVWMKDPEAIYSYDGQTLVGRRQADKITIINGKNDSVDLELEVNTHLPLRISYKWRNPQYGDWDEEHIEYEDYHEYQGIQTPLSITRYFNGDMISQMYITKATYNKPLDDKLFDPMQPYNEKHK